MPCGRHGVGGSSLCEVLAWLRVSLAEPASRVAALMAAISAADAANGVFLTVGRWRRSRWCGGGAWGGGWGCPTNMPTPVDLITPCRLSFSDNSASRVFWPSPSGARRRVAAGVSSKRRRLTGWGRIVVCCGLQRGPHLFFPWQRDVVRHGAKPSEGVRTYSGQHEAHSRQSPDSHQPGPRHWRRRESAGNHGG